MCLIIWRHTSFIVYRFYRKMNLSRAKIYIYIYMWVYWIQCYHALFNLSVCVAHYVIMYEKFFKKMWYDCYIITLRSIVVFKDVNGICLSLKLVETVFCLIIICLFDAFNSKNQVLNSIPKNGIHMHAFYQNEMSMFLPISERKKNWTDFLFVNSILNHSQFQFKKNVFCSFITSSNSCQRITKKRRDKVRRTFLKISYHQS